jgi:hypothetical protein
VRCASCQRNIAAGAEAQKMVIEYRQPDGSVQIRGHQMPDGPIKDATGVMERGYHSKCWWVSKKREAKGDAVTGRIIAGAPTGYDVDQMVLNREDLAALGLTLEQARERSTVQLSARVQRLRDLAGRIGKGVGDAQVQEAFAAQERGGPYAHEHHHRLDLYQLVAHLEYAHGLRDSTLLGTPGALNAQHIALHAQARVQADRRGDREPEPQTRDWRTQFTTEIE